MTKTPQVLMTDPTWFEVRYEINPWMRPGLWNADARRLAGAARRSFIELRSALESAGAEVSVAPGARGLPDMVFPANAAVVLDGRALMSRFLPPQRRGEEACFRAVFDSLLARGLIREIAEAPAGCFQEGAGDCLWDQSRRLFWAGWGQRSLRRAADLLAAHFGQQVVALELASPRFYHLDTCFCPLSGGEVLYYPPAFAPAALRAIREHVAPDRLIEATDEDADRFCVNAVSLGEVVVMAKGANRLHRILAERGYRVVEVDLAPFILAGGGAFCMTLRLDQTSQAAAPAPASLATA
jgi:N-dimethylarginine dimethylaminohydrolase